MQLEPKKWQRQQIYLRHNLIKRTENRRAAGRAEFIGSYPTSPMALSRHFERAIVYPLSDQSRQSRGFGSGHVGGWTKGKSLKDSGGMSPFCTSLHSLRASFTARLDNHGQRAARNPNWSAANDPTATLERRIVTSNLANIALGLRVP